VPHAEAQDRGSENDHGRAREELEHDLGLASSREGDQVVQEPASGDGRTEEGGVQPSLGSPSGPARPRICCTV